MRSAPLDNAREPIDPGLWPLDLHGGNSNWVTNCLGTGEAEALRLSQAEFGVTFAISAQCLESVAHFILVFPALFGYRNCGGDVPRWSSGRLYGWPLSFLTALYLSQDSKTTETLN